MREASLRSSETPVTLGADTFTLQVALKPPSAVVAVMVAEPAFTALTTPVSLTVATEVSLLDHVTSRFVASAGETVAVRVRLSPTLRDASLRSRETPVTAAVTFTVQVAFTSPSLPFAEAVMVAVPGLTAVTTPLLSTVATALSLLDHVTVLSVASEGLIVAVSVRVLPTWTSAESLSSLISFTGLITVTLQVALWPPSLVVMVMVVAPGFSAFTVPSFSMVATSLSLVSHLMDFTAAFSGLMVGLSLMVSPTASFASLLSSEMPVTGTATFTEQFAVNFPSLVETVMVAVPAFTPVTTPFWSTEATPLLLLAQVISFSSASKGYTPALRVTVLPTPTVTFFGLMEMPVTGFLMVISHVAVKSPSTVFTVMVALPVLSADTVPSLRTTAIFVSLDSQVTSLFVASVGYTVASSFSVSPTLRFAFFWLSETFVTTASFSAGATALIPESSDCSSNGRTTPT